MDDDAVVEEQTIGDEDVASLSDLDAGVEGAVIDAGEVEGDDDADYEEEEAEVADEPAPGAQPDPTGVHGSIPRAEGPPPE